MNIVEIKERVGLRAHMKTLCNNQNMLTNWVGSINYNNTEDDVIYLLSIIEQAEKAFEEINYQFELHEHKIVDNAIKKVDDIATEALQAIRKGD